MYSAILFVVCFHSRIGFSAALYPTNGMNGLNTGLSQQPNPLPVFNNVANQFISSYNKAFNSVSNGFNAGVQLSNQAMNNMRALQNNLQHAANPIASNPQLNARAGSGQQLNNIGGIQDRRQLEQTARNAVTQAQNLQMQQQVTRYGIQNGIQSQQRSHQNLNTAQNPLSRATNPMLNTLQRNFQISNRFIPQPSVNQLLSTQTLTRTVKSPQLPNPVDQNQIAQRLAFSNVQRPDINTQLSKSPLQGSTMELNKEYGFINPLEFLRKSVSTLNLSNEQRSVFNNLYNLLKNAMLTFNQEFTKGYGTAFQGVVNNNNALSSGLNQLSVIRMVNNQLSYFSKILNSIFTRIRSHIIENIKGIMQVFKLNCDDLQGSKKPDFSIPSSIAMPSLARINDTMVIGNQGNSSALSSLSTGNITQITNGTFNGISETKNVLSNSAHLIDDGSIFKAYLTKINSTQDTISKWDDIINNKGEDGTLNLTSFAKLDPFCNCNDIVSCNCCITLNMTLISKQVCLEATVPKATNGTKLSIIFDKTRQGMTQIKGSDEKVPFDLDLAKGELEITKRPGSNNTAEEFCGVASLETLGLRYPSLPLGCFRATNDTINLIDGIK